MEVPVLLIAAIAILAILDLRTYPHYLTYHNPGMIGTSGRSCAMPRIAICSETPVVVEYDGATDAGASENMAMRNQSRPLPAAVDTSHSPYVRLWLQHVTAG